MDNDALLEIIKKQEEALYKKPNFYLHYDPSNFRIINFRNYLEKTDSLPYVEMTESEIGISVSELDITKYFILPKKKKLEKIIDETFTISKIDDLIYEIPKVISEKRLTYKDKPFDLSIEQNNSLKEFKVKLSKTLKEKYKIQGITSQEMTVYVTATNDPNILYKTLRFRFIDVVSHEYITIPFEEFEGHEVNIYAFKYFDNYLHVDVR